MTSRHPAYYLFLLIFLPGLLFADYWQQKVVYDLDVTLIDSLHQVKGHETISYMNNSPDDLDYIWMHLWPNAYKNNRSALAKQKFNSFSTKMHFLPDSSFGWIDIENVTGGDQPLKWEYRSEDTLDVAKFYLPEPLASGDTLLMELDFTVRVPNVLSRLGHFGNHYEVTQWYPKPAVYDAKGWHPMSYLDMGEFYSEWGDFTVSITVPENYRVAATGVLQDSSELVWRDSLADLGNTYLDSFKMEPVPKLPGLKALIADKPASSKHFKTITFKQDKVHDFAWFADKRFIILRDDVELPSGRSTQTWTFALPKNLKNYRLSNTYIGDALSFYSESFMEYPYAHATVVDGDFSAGGGMEYPMITLINSTRMPPVMELVIMHEVGHNWFYGLSGSNERDYPWMDEGLNSYAENLYWANKYSDDYMLALHEEEPGWYALVRYVFKDATKSAIEDLSYYMSAMPKLDQAPNLTSEAFTDFNYGMMVYKKAALATESLHAYLGDTMMDSVWHAYFDTWAYKHPQPEDIRQVFETVSGEDLSWYFDDMLGSTGKIDYALDDFSSSPRGNGYETTVKISNHGDFSPPLAIGVKGEDAKEQKTVWVRPSGEHDVFQIQTDFPVKTAILDPDLTLLDVKRSNNDKQLNLDFDLAQLSLNPQADYIVTLIPYVWYDSIDLISPGLVLSHKNFIAWSDIDWYLRVFVGPITKAPGFTAAVGEKRFPQTGREIYHHARFANDWYYRLAEVSTNFRKRDLQFADDERNIKVSLLAQDLSDSIMVVNSETFRYLDPQVWDADQFLKTTLRYQTSTRRTLWKRSTEIIAAFGVREKGKPYGKFQSSFHHTKRYSRKGSIETTLFAGMSYGDLPRQERYYLSTSMDPDLGQKTIFSRHDNWYTPGHAVLYPNAYTIPGYLCDADNNITPSTSSLLGAKVSVDIPKLENFSLLVGVGLALDQNDDQWESIGSLSTVLKAGPLQIIYTPARLESDQLETDWRRFQLAIVASTGGVKIGI